VDQVVPLGTGRQVRLLQLQRHQQYSRKLGEHNGQYHLTQAGTGLWAVVQHRVLRRRRIWFPQQRRARSVYRYRSQDVGPGRAGYSYRPLPWLLFDFELSLSKARFTSTDPLDPSAGPYIPGAIPVTAHFGAAIENLGPWSGALEFRYFSSYPLIEDDSVRSDPSLLVNLRGVYQFDKTWKLQLDVLNLFNSVSNDITYYYASCPPNQIGTAGCPIGGGGEGVNDIHFHPTEPRQVRLTLIARF
jgi:outer membrane receptor protein involved in Fe transport